MRLFGAPVIGHSTAGRQRRLWIGVPLLGLLAGLFAVTPSHSYRFEELEDFVPPMVAPEQEDVIEEPAPAVPMTRSEPALTVQPVTTVDETGDSVGEAVTAPDLQSATVENQPTISDLLDQLADAESLGDARRIERQVQRMWDRSGSAAVDVLMRRAAIAMDVRAYATALDLLDTAITLAPDYAEAWNRRATVHFLRRDYGRSISDVEQVLKLEPRHFGALSGLGIMLDDLDRDAVAAEVLREALRVHPYLENTRQRLDRISERLEGSAI